MAGFGRGPHALRDLCIHRGTALSLGRVVGDRLMCPYHGWQYGADGVCKLIPQLADPTRIPGKARVDAFTCLERFGMLWVAMDEPRWGLPEIPEFDAAEWIVVRAGPYAWNSDASRQLENFTDFGHFPWVHPGCSAIRSGRCSRLLGAHRRARAALRHRPPRGPEQRRLPGVRKRGDGRARAPQPLPAAPPVHDPAAARLGWEEGMVYFFSSQPVDEDHCIGYVTIARNYDPEQPDRCCRTSRTRSSTRTSAWSSPSGRSACRSTSPPRCT